MFATRPGQAIPALESRQREFFETVDA